MTMLEYDDVKSQAPEPRTFLARVTMAKGEDVNLSDATEWWYSENGVLTIGATRGKILATFAPGAWLYVERVG